MSKAIDKVLENFTFEVGNGYGSSASGTIAKRAFEMDASSINNISYGDGNTSCNTTVSTGVDLKIFKYTSDRVYETSCVDFKQISEEEVIKSITVGPISVNDRGDVFFGLDITLNLIISGHLKFGWDFKNKQRKIMPAARNGNALIY